jgi:hypothetical protein
MWACAAPGTDRATALIIFNVPRLMDGVKRLMLPERIVEGPEGNEGFAPTSDSAFAPTHDAGIPRRCRDSHAGKLSALML